MTPLRISLDASAVPPQPAGAGRYVLELVRALSHRDEVSMDLITRRGDTSRWEALSPSQLVHGIVPDARPFRLVYEQIRLSRQLTRLGVQVHHGPHYTLPRNCPVPSVVTVHDMTFFDHPEVHESTKVHFFQSAIRSAASNATVIVCVSQRTAERFSSLFPRSAPVLVAPHGIDHDRFRPQPSIDDREPLARLGLDPVRPRIVHLGTLEPRKGITTLLNAFERVLASVPDCELVFAGQRGWGVDSFDEALAASPASESVTLLGYVADDEIPPLLRSASVLAYPSIDEGFGLPALEALACGVPVVTTRGSVMEDLCGEAAWLASPGDVRDLGRVLVEVLESPEDLKEARKVEGITRAGEFTWAKAAQLHVEAYELARSLRS